MNTQTLRRPRAAAAKAERGGDKIAQSSAFQWFARAGFVARAAIYAIIGILAVKLALGSGGETTSQKGALQTIAHQPFGHVLLILVAVALAGYSLWRFVRALLGHGPEGADSGMDRVAAFASGVAYAAICALAVSMLLGSGGSGGSTAGTQKETAGVLGWPGGTWLVCIAGALFVGVGFYQIYRGVSKDFMDDSKTEQMSRRIRNVFEWAGTFGYVARGVVFGLIGFFLVKAAVDYNPNKAVGLDGALAKLAHDSYGPILLGIVAAGLVAFGLYSLADARYRRI